jgi:hypothetical protein
MAVLWAVEWTLVLWYMRGVQIRGTLLVLMCVGLVLSEAAEAARLVRVLTEDAAAPRARYRTVRYPKWWRTPTGRWMVRVFGRMPARPDYTSMPWWPLLPNDRVTALIEDSGGLWHHEFQARPQSGSRHDSPESTGPSDNVLRELQPSAPPCNQYDDRPLYAFSFCWDRSAYLEIRRGNVAIYQD